MAAYDLEEENEIDYNVFKVRNWLFDALQDNPNLAQDLIEEMTNAFAPKGKQ